MSKSDKTRHLPSSGDARQDQPNTHPSNTDRSITGGPINAHGHVQAPLIALAIGALGVVFGDIGTSPLYAFKLVFVNAAHPVSVTHDNVLGILSLFFWSLMMVVTVKYVLFIMRANNQGEGGIVALLTLLLSHLPTQSRWRGFFIAMGMLGAAFFYGDGVITPAISVLSAVEGLEILSPALKVYVIPVSLAILVMLFWFQKHGTDKIGKFFGPVMLVWFVVLAVLGLWQVFKAPVVLEALNPWYALQFSMSHGWISFFALGSVVLCITGAEALYADMGHFGARPIQTAWLVLVFPALILNYFGQGALILSQPEAIQNPFYLMAPDWALHVLIVFSTIATVIASQAVISGAFSITQQAMQLRFLPNVKIVHTSDQQVGQIYAPAVNWIMLMLIIALVLIFQSSDALGTAYGIAVTGTMLITDFFAVGIAIAMWRWQPWRAVLGASFFMLIDVIFFSANTLKLLDGGWFPVAFSVVVLTVMVTWRKGLMLMQERAREQDMLLTEFIDQEVPDSLPRSPGLALYLTSDRDRVPVSLWLTRKHFNILHEHILCVRVNVINVPYVSPEQCVQMESFGKGIRRIELTYGFKDQIDSPASLRRMDSAIYDEHLEGATFFVTRHRVQVQPGPGMSLWNKKLFVFLLRNGHPSFRAFNLPRGQVVELGSRLVL